MQLEVGIWTGEPIYSKYNDGTQKYLEPYETRPMLFEVEV